MSSQKFSFPVRKQAAFFLFYRHDPVIDPYKKQYLNMIQPGSGDITHHYSVHGGWNQAHLDLRKSGVQNFPILSAAYMLFS